MKSIILTIVLLVSAAIAMAIVETASINGHSITITSDESEFWNRWEYDNTMDMVEVSEGYPSHVQIYGDVTYDPLNYTIHYDGFGVKAVGITSYATWLGGDGEQNHNHTDIHHLDGQVDTSTSYTFTY